VVALIKAVIIIQETLSLVKMDAILVLALLDKLLVRMTPVAALI